MIDLNNIKNFTIPRPEPFNFIGTAKEFDELPETHKEQILFLDKAAGKWLFEFASTANLTTGRIWDPFEKGNFKTVEKYDRFYGIQNSKQELKKWLYQRGIPFRRWVFVLMEDHDQPLLMTWKMAIKYCEHIFFAGDTMVFDNSLNWCLVYFHENEMFFGKDNVYDPTEDQQKMEALNERKRKYPQFRHPYL